MWYYIYILKSDSRERWSYVGYTNNIKRRFTEHCYGKVRSTKGCRPLKLVYYEKFNNEFEARKREKYLKSGVGRVEKK